MLNGSSCGKEKSTPPDIAFYVGTAYVYEDTALVHGTIFNIGVAASKTGVDGLLTGFEISHRMNGSPDSVIQKMSFIEQYFSQYYSYTAGDSGNVEQYTFTAIKADGRTNSISVNITDL